MAKSQGGELLCKRIRTFVAEKKLSVNWLLNRQIEPNIGSGTLVKTQIVSCLKA